MSGARLKLVEPCFIAEISRPVLSQGCCPMNQATWLAGRVVASPASVRSETRVPRATAAVALTYGTLCTRRWPDRTSTSYPSSRSLCRSALRLISALCIEDHPVGDEHRLAGDQRALAILVGTALVGNGIDYVFVEDGVVERQPHDVFEREPARRDHLRFAVHDDLDS